MPLFFIRYGFTENSRSIIFHVVALIQALARDVKIRLVIISSIAI